ncbi:hypothetical protein E1200_27255 [Actinomadura sp. GC306]|uniref:hypothetical protein n=1 Tax=Actinomadura sp. GC306 TaxID=2530367 RepID=UPI00104FCCE3|nr:hypothetical protein [Actinomadura sp. GC306]TDC62020.1 hypothetical protein E1200_27255 [Actinomadura sp. GC306]
MGGVMAGLVRVWDDLPGPVRVLIGGRALTLRRPLGDGLVPPPCDEHLVAGPDEPSRAWRACADVIVGRAGDPARLLAAHPGCLVAVAVTETGCRVAAGGLEARLDPVLGGECAAGDAALYASALHAWLVTGGRPGALTRLTLVRGNTVTAVKMTGLRDRRAARPEGRRAVP